MKHPIEQEKLGGIRDLYSLSRNLTDDKPLGAPAFVKHPGKNWRGYVERIGFRLGIILTTLGIGVAIIQNGLNMAAHDGASFDWLSAGPLITYAGCACFFSYAVMGFVPNSKN